jgi:hypothetical protein
LSGAIFTTDPQGNRVNQNIYDSKDQVYLQGGPDQQGAHLPDGLYYYRVTDPSGHTVLYPEGYRTVTVANGVFPATQLAPFTTTPNQGGEYKVWVSRVSTFNGRCTKTDNFKVRSTEPTPTPTNTPTTLRMTMEAKHDCWTTPVKFYLMLENTGSRTVNNVWVRFTISKGENYVQDWSPDWWCVGSILPGAKMYDVPDVYLDTSWFVEVNPDATIGLKAEITNPQGMETSVEAVIRRGECPFVSTPTPTLAPSVTPTPIGPTPTPTVTSTPIGPTPTVTKTETPPSPPPGPARTDISLLGEGFWEESWGEVFIRRSHSNDGWSELRDAAGNPVILRFAIDAIHNEPASLLTLWLSPGEEVDVKIVVHPGRGQNGSCWFVILWQDTGPCDYEPTNELVILGVRAGSFFKDSFHLQVVNGCDPNWQDNCK